MTHVAQALHLSTEEVNQISRLVTEKRSHAQAYVVNGERGRGTVAIRLGPHLYWLATSDPVNDVSCDGRTNVSWDGLENLL